MLDKFKNLRLVRSVMTHPLFWICAASTCLHLVLLVIIPQVPFGDLPSYASAWDENLSQGQIDAIRTPFLPAICGFCHWIMGEEWLYALAFIQICLFILSIIFVKKILQALNVRAWIMWSMLLLYAFFKNVIYFNLVGSTESFSLSLTPILLYLIWRLLALGNNNSTTDGKKVKAEEWKLTGAIAVMVFLLVALRPTFIVLFPIAGSLLIAALIMKQARRQALLLVVATIPTAVGCIFYTDAMARRYDVRLITSVSVINDFYSLRIPGETFEEYIDDPDVVAHMHWADSLSLNAGYDSRHFTIIYEAMLFNDYMGTKDLKRYVDTVKANHPDYWVKCKVQDFTSMFTKPRYWFAQACVAIFVVFGCLSVFVRRYRSLFTMLLSLWLGGYIATVVLGAGADFSRLLHPVFPLAMIMTAVLLDRLRQRR